MCKLAVFTISAIFCITSQAFADGNGVKEIKVFRDCPECPEMVVLPAGNFEMGSKSGEMNEIPVHRVKIRNKFAMGKTEVTQAQWRWIMGNNPSHFKSCGDDCPVEMVSWDDVKVFIKRLNDKVGKKYRLPTEAEWEYACRAGGAQEFCGSDDVDSVAWYGANGMPKGNSKVSTNRVGQKQANAFGLYDMSGNVWEWVEDSYHANYVGAPADGSAWNGDGAKRILRGGAWDDEEQFSRSAVRYMKAPLFNANYDGFRLVRDLP